MPNHQENYGRQDKGFAYLGQSMPGFYVPNSKEKDSLLELLGISKSFKQTFDAVRLSVPKFSDVKSARDFDLLEIKTTDKCLPDLPCGFFFGLTENEEMLLKVFNGKYLLCFVSLHTASAKYALVGWDELRNLTKHKRIQYQINLHANRDTDQPPKVRPTKI